MESRQLVLLGLLLAVGVNVFMNREQKISPEVRDQRDRATPTAPAW